MDRVRLVDAELEYEVHAAGEPVVLVHNDVLADWFTPLLDQPALAGPHRALSRRGIRAAASSRAPSAWPTTLATAEDSSTIQASSGHMSSVTRPARTSPCSSRSTFTTWSRPSPCS
jgi:hypothetical protein